MGEVNAGVYRVTCTVNGRVYFGSSMNLKRRLGDHRRDLMMGRHNNQRLQEDWRLYGPDAFEFKILLRCSLPKYELLELENSFLAANWDKQVHCYNVARDARAPMRGRKASDQTRAKMAEANVGRKHSEETRAKMSESAKKRTKTFGRKASEETKAKMAAAKRGSKHTEETKAKIALAGRGRRHSDETRAKIASTKQLRKAGR